MNTSPTSCEHIEVTTTGGGWICCACGVRLLSLSVPIPLPTVQLWGFFHTTCTYESAAGLVSLHRTKAGAWRAMRQAQWDAWEELRSTENTYLHLDRETRRWMRCDKSYVHERSHVRAVEVLP